MSKRTCVVCDICGIDISPFRTKEESALIRLWPPNDYRTSSGQRIDLCVQCYDNFVSFLEAGRTFPKNEEE